MVLLAGSIAMGVFGSLFSLSGLELYLPSGLSVTLCCAIAGLVAGLGLLALIQQHRTSRLGMSVVLAGLSLYTLASTVGAVDAHLESVSVMQRSVAALMMLPIAVGLWLGVKGALRRVIFRRVGVGVFWVGLTTLLLDLIPQQPGVLGRLQDISVHLSSGFYLVFGLGMRYVADHWQRFPLTLARRHRDVAVIGATLSVLGWLLVGWQQFRVEAEQAGHAADVVQLTSESAIARHEQALRRMAERWGVLGGLPEPTLRAQEVNSYLRDHPALKGIAYIDSQASNVWHRSSDVEARSQWQAWWDAAAVRQQLSSQGDSPRWLFLGSDQPTKALLAVVIPGPSSRRLIAFVDAEALLTKRLRPELARYHLHLDRDAETLLEVSPREHQHDHEKGAHVLKPLATRLIDLSGAAPLRVVIFGGPPSYWSASGLLSTGVGAGTLILSYLLAFIFGLMTLSQLRARQLDHTNQQLQLQYQAQSLIARESSYRKSLESVCRMLEQQLPGRYCSIMLCNDGQTVLHDAVGPNLPRGYLDELKEVEIGPGVGACGSAAHSRKLVVCADLATDPRWEGYRDLIQRHQLGSCWSFPLVASSGQVLGTMALYHADPGAPGADERQLAMKAVDLAVLAIERHHDRQALIDSEHRYRSLFTHHPDAVFSMDLAGHFVSLNARTADLVGLPAGDMVGKHFSRFVESADVPQGQVLFESAKAGQALRYELQSRDVHGDRHVLDITTIPILSGKHVTGVFGIAKDVTASKADEMQLRVLERSLEASVNGVAIVDVTLPDMPIIFANHAFSHITGYSNAEVKGRNCRFLQGPDTEPAAVEEIRRGLAEERDVQVTLCNYRKNGERFWNELHISPVSDAKGQVSHFIGVTNEVTQRIADEEALTYQASHDGLTGVYNRARFEEHLRQEAERIQREQGLMVVLFIDLDDFKPINDTLGHATGDRLLVAVAGRLAEALGPGDSLGRFGGDEFLVLLPKLEHERQAQATVDRLLAALSRSYQVDGHAFRLSASIGMASSREVSLQHPEQLITRADSAMYAAKKQGGNTAGWYRYQAGIELSQRVELRKDMQDAIEEDQFSLHYQPLMNSAGDVLGFEALIRWQHPTKGWISPGSFIPVAEITGQIIPISEWVLTQVCRDLPSLRRLGAKDCRVAVNMSPMQFLRPTFLSNLEQRLQESHIPPHWLELEVTEGILMEDKDVAISILHALRDLGVGVAVDDFGTGFSSLSYLKQLPVSKVKIDRSFVRDLTTDADDKAIVQGILSMAHHMALAVVAEGVETEDQLQCLTDFGCDIFQGYLLARPMPLEQLRAFLARSPAL
ncbi:bifunctional diguanylate cyclase/phosphodiesterase [Onishia taeanensis]